jgi:hypothetical protein
MYNHRRLIRFYLQDRIKRLTSGENKFTNNKIYGNFVLETKFTPHDVEYIVKDIYTAL